MLDPVISTCRITGLPGLHEEADTVAQCLQMRILHIRKVEAQTPCHIAHKVGEPGFNHVCDRLLTPGPPAAFSLQNIEGKMTVMTSFQSSRATRKKLYGFGMVCFKLWLIQFLYLKVLDAYTFSSPKIMNHSNQCFQITLLRKICLY